MVGRIFECSNIEYSNIENSNIRVLEYSKIRTFPKIRIFDIYQYRCRCRYRYRFRFRFRFSISMPNIEYRVSDIRISNSSTRKFEFFRKFEYSIFIDIDINVGIGIGFGFDFVFDFNAKYRLYSIRHSNIEYSIFESSKFDRTSLSRGSARPLGAKATTPITPSVEEYR